MKYKFLYDEVQSLSPKIKTGFLRQRVLCLSGLVEIREIWSGEFDTEALRGCFICGPLGPPLNLGERCAVIILARELNKCWRRFVLTKELMHAFDEPEEITDGPEKLDKHLFGLDDLSTRRNPQVRSETKAFWRALGVLCPEKDRVLFKEKLSNGEMMPYDVALRLKIPEAYVGHLMRDDFLDLMAAVK